MKLSFHRHALGPIQLRCCRRVNRDGFELLFSERRRKERLENVLIQIDELGSDLPCFAIRVVSAGDIKCAARLAGSG